MTRGCPPLPDRSAVRASSRLRAFCYLMSLQSRLAELSHAQLLDIALDACESSPKLKNKADALIAEVAPLPAWCVDNILMSPDLLPQLFSSFGLS